MMKFTREDLERLLEGFEHPQLDLNGQDNDGETAIVTANHRWLYRRRHGVPEAWQDQCECSQQYGYITGIQECCHYYDTNDVDGVNELLGATAWTLMSRHRWSRSPYNVDLQ